jgi:hypothetical protein
MKLPQNEQFTLGPVTLKDVKINGVDTADISGTIANNPTGDPCLSFAATDLVYGDTYEFSLDGKVYHGSVLGLLSVGVSGNKPKFIVQTSEAAITKKVKFLINGHSFNYNFDPEYQIDTDGQLELSLNNYRGDDVGKTLANLYVDEHDVNTIELSREGLTYDIVFGIGY